MASEKPSIMINRIFALIVVFLLVSTKMEADSIPFKLVRKSILVEATVNNVSGYFILDTGTPSLVLNNQYFEGQLTGEKMIGLVGKEMNIYKTEVNLTMGDLKWSRVEAALTSLDHLSGLKGVPILGLIGNNVLKYFELTINFDALKLELVKNKKKTTSEKDSRLPDVSFKFAWRAGIPVVKTTVGGEVLIFGLDTGAGINVLNRQKGELLTDHLTMNNNVNVFGMDKKGQNLQSGLIHNVVVENYYCPEMKIVLVSMARFKGFGSQLNSLDGFLGYEFLKYFRTVVNYKTRTINLYYRNDLAKNYIVAR